MQIEKAVGNILLDRETLNYIIAKDIYFNGFDEVWFFPEQPRLIEAPPERLCIERFMRNPDDANMKIRISKLIQWMNVSNAMLGLSDGYQLDFLTTSKNIQQKMLRYDV